MGKKVRLGDHAHVPCSLISLIPDVMHDGKAGVVPLNLIARAQEGGHAMGAEQLNMIHPQEGLPESPIPLVGQRLGQKFICRYFLLKTLMTLRKKEESFLSRSSNHIKCILFPVLFSASSSSSSSSGSLSCFSSFCSSFHYSQ